MNGTMTKKKDSRAGFTLIESVVGIVLVAIAVLGLVQMFTMSLMNNVRSDRITAASFLAQQRADALRNLTKDELNTLAASGSVDLNADGAADIDSDELLDLNLDNHNDYRRLTEVVQVGPTSWSVHILVFTPEQFGIARSQLMAGPDTHRVRANYSTLISRG
jgi:prepilin-type N-terminal cleavage/methylation domain-containing protein